MKRAWKRHGARHQRRLIAWRRYQRRCDRLCGAQDLTVNLEHPIRVTSGFYRAEGWKTGPRSVLRHGS